MSRTLTLLFALAALPALACSPGNAAGDPPAAISFDTTRLRLASGTDTVEIRVELAITEQQQTMGLMERTSLPRDAGMLFLYDSEQPATSGFWMFRTRIPLDIAFIDSAGVIRSIVPMEPCPSPFAARCPAYESGVPFTAALEMNRGFFAERGLAVGDRVLLEDVPRR